MERDPLLVLGKRFPRSYTWSYVCVLLGIYLIANFLSALALPLVHHLILHQSTKSAEIWRYLAQKPIGKIFDRLRWIPLLIGVLWLFRDTQLLSWQRLGVRLKFSGVFWNYAGKSILLTALLCIIQLGFSHWIPKSANYFSIFCSSFFGAMAVAFLEEIVFRGLILRAFYTAARPLPTMLFSSLFFAYVHFRIATPAAIHLQSSLSWPQSFQIANDYLFGIGRSFQPIPFLSLFMLGNLLTLLVYIHRHLMAAMGFHFGLVFLLLIYRKLFIINNIQFPNWIGSNNLIDSPLALLLMSILTIYYYGRWMLKPTEVWRA